MKTEMGIGQRVGFLFATFAAALALASGCGGSDPVFDTVDGGGNNDALADARPSADAGASTACFTTPSRMVVLGDSITACSTVDGIQSATCGPKLFYQYLEATYAPGLTYENLSVPGALTENVPAVQLGTIPVGTTGHVVVLIYIGGNDLQPYIFSSDAEAQAQYDVLKPAVLEDWEEIYAFFNDAAKFPDGATVMMNTQYNPFDDCTASPYNLSELKTSLLHQFNGELTKVANERANAVITDQHAPFLGHGHHYTVSACPYFQAGVGNWMADMIHPNDPGHANLAEQWKKTADLVYRDNCD